jgi:hypothetical protein
MSTKRPLLAAGCEDLRQLVRLCLEAQTRPDGVTIAMVANVTDEQAIDSIVGLIEADYLTIQCDGDPLREGTAFWIAPHPRLLGDGA